MSNVTYTDINTQTETLGANIQFSRSLVNQFRLGYARGNTEGNQTVDNFGGATPVNLATALGIGGYPNPSTYFDEYINTVGDAVLETFNPFDQSRQWNLTDTMSLTHGHHEFKVGIDYRRIKSPVVASGNPYVEFDFLTEDEILSNSALFAVFSKQASATPVFNETSLFVQDNWRAARNLNVAMGVRWEVDPAPGEAHGNYAYTTFGSVSDPSTLTLAPRGTPLWNTSWFNMAPRLGVAWTVHSTPGWETVLRTGGGVFFDTDNQLAPLAYSAIGFDAYQDTYFASIPATPSDLNFSISTVPPYTGTIVVAFPSHLQLPYTLDWNTSLQQVLGKSQAVTISYVGSKGSRLLQWRRYSLNALNSNFGSVDALQNNITANYQAMQVQFQRTVSRGVSVLAAYTWSHSLDYGSNDYSLPATRGNSDFGVRNNLTVGATWSLPSVQCQKLINALLKHWDLDGRFSARTGFPVTLYGNYFTDPTGDTYYGNLNLVPNEPIYLYGSVYPGGRAINPAAFSYPVGSGVGTAPRNFVRGFGAEQINLAAQRQIPLHERLNLKFRAEAFNLFNHPNFGHINPYLTQAQFGLATQMLNQSLTTMSSLYQQGGSRSLQFALKLSF